MACWMYLLWQSFSVASAFKHNIAPLYFVDIEQNMAVAKQERFSSMVPVPFVFCPGVLSDFGFCLYCLAFTSEETLFKMTASGHCKSERFLFDNWLTID